MVPRKRYPTNASMIFASLLMVLSASAQAGMTLDGSVGTPATLTGPDYVIPHTVGTTAGSNLFHSFGTFNISQTESATFTSPSTVTNIIGRITGGSPSTIDGQIRSMLTDGTTRSSANLYLLNPSGVMFGPNATLDIGGSFHVSTADYIKFSNGDRFYADRLSASILSVAEPAAFGFLSANPAAITVDQSVLQVPENQTISLVGGGITLTNDPAKPSYFDYDNFVQGTGYYMLSAPGGRINIASVGSAGEVTLNDANLGAASFSSLGDITLQNGANLTVASDIFASGAAGSIVMRGKDILIKDLGLPGMAYGIEASGNPAGYVDIKGRSLQIDNASITANGMGEIDQVGSAFTADLTGSFSMVNGSLIDTSNFGSGRAGDILIKAGTIILGDEIPGTGPQVDAGFYGYLNSSTYGSGKGGGISLTAQDILVRNGFYVVTSALDQGDAGTIIVNSDTLKFIDQGNIGSNAYGSGFDIDGNPIRAGSAGALSIESRDILISAINSNAVTNSSQISGISSQVDGKSNGGKISVIADTLQISDGGKISTVLYGTGLGSDVDITTKNLAVSGYYADASGYRLSSIDGRLIGATASGTGGNILITTDALKLDNAGNIRTSLFSDAPGNAGNISINAKTIDITSRGQIYADSFRGTGNSGNLSVTANSMNITGANNVPRPEPLDFDFTGLSTTTNTGTGGKITVALAGNLTASEGGGIKADTKGTGSGGAIDISALNVNLSGIGTAINALSADAGAAGNIIIKTGQFDLATSSSVTTQAQAGGAGGTVTITADKLNLSDSGQITSSAAGAGSAGTIGVTLTGDLTASSSGAIKADTTASGTGGAITVDAKNVILTDKGNLGASASGSGNAGDVSVKTGTVKLESGGSIATSTAADGLGGTVTITAASLEMGTGGQITSSAAGSGNAGKIGVTLTGDLTSSASSISADTTAGGTGGAIMVDAKNVILTDKGTLGASASGSGNAGDISVKTSGNVQMSSGGGITTSTADTGTGGKITVTASTLDMASGSQISSSSGGTGNAGNINVTAGNLIQLRNASITSEALLANGGEISLNALTKINLINSVITAKVQGDAQTVGGKIFIDPQFVVMKNSTIDATAVDGRGGTIRLVADTFLADPQSSVTAYSQKGISGTVDIQAPVSNISGIVSPLSSDYVSAATLLRERCIARIREGKYSSFVIGGRDGLPLEPGNMLPGFLF
jgi:filamentous hemagglutinin family protein